MDQTPPPDLPLTVEISTPRKRRKPMPSGTTKTGRRKRSEERQRTALVVTRHTPQEKAAMQAAAARAGLDLASFIRQQTLGTTGPRTRAAVPSQDLAAWAEWRAQLGKIESNLTQLSQLADMGDMDRPADLARVRAFVSGMRSEARAVMRAEADGQRHPPRLDLAAWSDCRERLTDVGGSLNRLTRLANMGDMDRPADLDRVLLIVEEAVREARTVMRPDP